MDKNNILLVDDEAIILRTINKELQADGYEVAMADTGKKGIALLNRYRFDLIVTDLMMEGVDGLQVLKQAKKIDSGLPVIILTGHGDIRSAIDALRLGADDYLLKPCDIEELLFRISGCLEKSAMRKKIKIYEKILPVCSVCKKIRDDADKEPGKGTWMSIEQYLVHKSGVQLSHGYCKDCYNEAIKNL